MDSHALQSEIASTLRGLVEVPTLGHHGLSLTREFWRRGQCLQLTFEGERPPQIMVDGFVGQCRWNSWKVYNDALEDGLSLWSGFALWHGRWVPHSWCMLGERIVESTIVFRIYYGAAHSPPELDAIAINFAKTDPTVLDDSWINTWKDGQRVQLPFDLSKHESGICRERDWETGQIKKGLGRD